MSNKDVKMCQFNLGERCAATRINTGEQRENCLLCLLTQQNSMLKSACRVILSNKIENDQNDAFEIIATAANTEMKFKRWVERYREDLLREVKEAVEQEMKDLEEPVIMGPEGIMTREQAIAKLIAMNKGGMQPE